MGNFKRDYKLSVNVDANYQSFVFAIGIINEQPRSQYKTGLIVLGFVFIFWEVRFCLSFKYKKG